MYLFPFIFFLYQTSFSRVIHFVGLVKGKIIILYTNCNVFFLLFFVSLWGYFSSWVACSFYLFSKMVVSTVTAVYSLLSQVNVLLKSHSQWNRGNLCFKNTNRVITHKCIRNSVLNLVHNPNMHFLHLLCRDIRNMGIGGGVGVKVGSGGRRAHQGSKEQGCICAPHLHCQALEWSNWTVTGMPF